MMADTIEEAGVARKAATTDERTAQRIEALRFERNGYVVRGLSDRVAQVDVELAKLGVKKSEPKAEAKIVKSDD
jgi:hypothetical protein